VDDTWAQQPIVFVVPGPLTTRTGGYIYDARIIEGLRGRGASVEVVELRESLACATEEGRGAAALALSRVDDGGVVVIDGLMLPALAAILEREANRLKIVAVVHLPLAAGIELNGVVAEQIREQEGRALRTTRRIIVTSPATIPMLESYNLPSRSICVVEPGTDRAPMARGSGGSEVHLLCVATVNGGKGHEILLRALACVPARTWVLTCAGSLTRDPAAVERVQRVIMELGLADRVRLAGELDASAIEASYNTADVFVLATLQETYGMAVAEALAHGLPVVSTTTGAIASLVGMEAGIVVPPGDADALSEALSRMIRDPDLRATLAEGARRMSECLPTWDDACETFAAALQTVRHE
jgi:glycosyltransferase involved in cell wall biosynthesis